MWYSSQRKLNDTHSVPKFTKLTRMKRWTKRYRDRMHGQQSEREQQAAIHSTSRNCKEQEMNREKKKTNRKENNKKQQQQPNATNMNTKMEWMCIGNKFFAKMNIFGAVKSRKRHTAHWVQWNVGQTRVKCTCHTNKCINTLTHKHTHPPHTIAKHKAIRLRIFDFHFIYGERASETGSAGQNENR